MIGQMVFRRCELIENALRAEIEHGPLLLGHVLQTIDVVAFKSGDWRQLLRASGDQTLEWPNAGAPRTFAIDNGPAFLTREWLQARLQTLVTETYAAAEPPPRQTLLTAKVERTDGKVG
jgi:hypothetical protein